MSDRQSRTIGTSVLVEVANGEQYVIAEIEIDCPVCGQHTVRFAGHHLRAIRNFLTETIDTYPDATLKDGDVHAIEHLTFDSRGPGDPSHN